MKFDNLPMIIGFMCVVFVSGIVGGVLYFEMNLLKVNLQAVDFNIPIEDPAYVNVTNITTFQDIMEITIYPLFDVKDALPYLTYFLIFGFVIALGMTSYLTSKNNLFFILHLLFMILMTYFAIILQNTYVNLMGNSFMNDMMVDFPIYNKVMFNFGAIVFFTTLLFGVISFINIMKPASSTSYQGINYGGDY